LRQIWIGTIALAAAGLVADGSRPLLFAFLWPRTTAHYCIVATMISSVLEDRGAPNYLMAARMSPIGKNKGVGIGRASDCPSTTSSSMNPRRW
jgi:hypothetical protein